jgi:hypothetical protein
MRRALLAILIVLAPGCNSLLGLEPPPAPAGDGGATPGSDAPSATGHTPYWTFSDDFELGDLRRWTKPGFNNNNAPSVTRDNAASGCCAMHAAVAAGASGFAYELITLQGDGANGIVTAGTIAMRARIKALQLDHDTREIAVVEGGTQATQFATSGLGGDGGHFTWGYDVSDPGADNVGKVSSATVSDAIGGWHCIEVVIDVADAGHVAVFSDDAPTPLVDGDVNTLAAPGWDGAQIGLPFASGTTNAEILLDDAVVSLYHDRDRGIHIGCK